MMIVSNVQSDEHNESTSYYLGLVPKGNFEEELQHSTEQVVKFFAAVPPHLEDYAYAEGKWSIKEVLQHIIDVERIFAYRALRFARKETASLPGFDVDDYGVVAEATRRSLAELIEEYRVTRQSTLLLFRSFTPEMLLRKGIASGDVISVRAAGFKLIGHDIHHCQIIKERYLSQ